MFLSYSPGYQVVFCRVGPPHSEYGVGQCVYTLYTDGSYSTISLNHHWRSRPNVLKKPMMEYSINELMDVIDGINGLNHKR